MKKILTIITIFLLSFILTGIFLQTEFEFNNVSPKEKISPYKDSDLKKSTSNNLTNYEILEDITISKLEEYNSQEYFSQYYLPSIQATYYALSIADFLNSFDSMNKTSLRNFIMNHYDMEENIFSDDYSDRYLDTNFNLTYYSLNSLLEVNCYAYLCLDILNHTELIDETKFLDFIWSCFNYEEGG
jgi:prenyltransferase beta subunit